MTTKEYWYWLCNVPTFGSKKISKLLNLFQSPEILYSLKDERIKKIKGISEKDIEAFIESKKIDWSKEYNKLIEKRIEFITPIDPNYPKRLEALVDKPYGLYVKGALPQNKIPTVAIIGSRNCSNYGLDIAKEFGRELAHNGIQIISGLARGIDGAGQRGAILGGGKTFGILAGGVDICYPRENIELYMEVQESGGLIGENPVGSAPLAWQFPMRNRIISGLSDIVLIVEAKEKSGSLITVDFALEQGKDVFAVPGRLTDKLSKGCNELIKFGAGIATKPEDILEELGIKGRNIAEENQKKEFLLAESERMLYSCLDLHPKNIQDIIEETGLSVSGLTESLLRLQLEGLIDEKTKGYYVIKEK